MPDRPIDRDARAGASTARHAAGPTASGTRYTLAAARDAGYRALERLDAEMALASAPDGSPPSPTGRAREG